MPDIDALIVGAGPTGLMLGIELVSRGARVRVIDALAERGSESRALVIQARSLELLDRYALAAPMVQEGRRAPVISLTWPGNQEVRVPLRDIARADTRFPYVLVLAQSETERILREDVERRGGRVERPRTLTALAQHEDGVTCTVRAADGEEERIEAAYVVGCDGAHSTVRRLAGIPFEGAQYTQSLLLADCDADGVDAGSIHARLGTGFTMAVPLGRPAPWRVIAMESEVPPQDAPEPTLADVETLARGRLGPRVTLRDAKWVTRFRLSHRMAARFREGRVFLAGDAAHIHSPVAGQGMNTGLQDAANLGWKLAAVTAGRAPAQLLDSYAAERMPVARFLLRFTDRLFAVTTSVGIGAKLSRTFVIPTVARVGSMVRPLRMRMLRIASQLGIRYRESPAVAQGLHAPRGPLAAGDRLPDLELDVDGVATHLQTLLRDGASHLLVTGTAEASLPSRYGESVRIHRVARPGPLGDGFLLVRPDGHIAFRGGPEDAGQLAGYLARWFTPSPHRAPEAAASGR